MKTVKKDNEVRRVRDTEGEVLVKNGWAYVSKSVWKGEVRDYGKKKEPAKKVEKKVEQPVKRSQYKKV